MAIPQISLAQFNRIASGEYNAGFVDFKTDRQGNVLGELRKVNNHVHSTSKNNEVISPERVLEVKEAFINALRRGGVSDEDIAAVRKNLGIPAEMEVTDSTAKMRTMLETRFTPLTRQHVRHLLDKYANRGSGFTEDSAAEVTRNDAAKAERSRNMSASNVTTRKTVNLSILQAAKGNVDYKLTDVMSLLSGTRSLADFKGAQMRRIKGEGPEADGLRESAVRKMANNFSTLYSQVLKLQSPAVNETAEFEMFGTTVKLSKGEDGNVKATVGSGDGKVTVSTNRSAFNLLALMTGRAAVDRDALGSQTVKSLLKDKVYAADIKNGLLASDRTSLTRQFACVVLNMTGGGIVDEVNGKRHLVDLAKCDYNTGLLVQLALKSLDGDFDGENVIDTKAKLDNFYANLRKDTANLPDDIKSLLEGVAKMPLELDEQGSFMVSAPIVGDINEVVAEIPPPPLNPPSLPKTIGTADIKDFVADIVFSSDTMVSDVVVNQPGEMTRKLFMDDRKMAMLVSILKNPAVLDLAAAPEIAGILKDGFAQIKAKLAAAVAEIPGNGQTLYELLSTDDGVKAFAGMFRDPDKIKGEVIAEFEDVIDEMANKAAESMQTFVNKVFNVHVNDADNATTNPYKNMTPEQIKAQLDGKTLNEIIDSAAQSDAPGQVGFFKQVISTYFTSLEMSDKRACLSSALKFASPYDFGELQGKELESAKKAAVNKFTGAVLKGASPLMHKMMQGLPKEIVGDYADALADMKSNLAPIPRKIVQGYLNKMIADSNGKIKSVKLEKSLGAASVGEAFLCKVEFMDTHAKMRQMEYGEIVAFKKAHPGEKVKTWTEELDGDGNPIMETTLKSKQVVVKIMRHDAERRVKREAEIFTAAAQKIPGMAKTWEGQLKQYMTEFDFTKEADNVNEGVRLYGITDDKDHPLQAMASDVASMKMSNLAAPQKNLMVAEAADGQTVDKYFKTQIEDIRNSASSVFERDPSTGRIQWKDKVDPVSGQVVTDPKTGLPVKVPVLRNDIPAMSVGKLKQSLSDTYDNLAHAANKIQQATKAWFYNAIIGDGKFHGDTHAGNLMVTRSRITFIDFGNLYQLNKAREDGVNEQQDLLRVVAGAAFRNNKLFLTGFRNLMSAEGKNTFDENYAKAAAILNSVLAPSRGAFSFDIVYRLQAAIVELQKLGLELPPQINCFILSMVRLSNVVSEMNTIMNQCKAMETAIDDMRLQPPERDELDLLGRAFDSFASDAGHEQVAPYPDDPVFDEVFAGEDYTEPAFLKMMKSPEFGGTGVKMFAGTFLPGGEYFNKVQSRMAGAQDKLAAAEALCGMLRSQCDPKNVDSLEVLDMIDGVEGAPENGMLPSKGFLAKFREAWNAADTEEKRNAAISQFTTSFSHAVATGLGNMVTTFKMSDARMFTDPTPPPASFASAITGVLFGCFDNVNGALGFAEKVSLGLSAKKVVDEELKPKFANQPPPEDEDDDEYDDSMIGFIMRDAKSEGVDTSYKIDIGV